MGVNPTVFIRVAEDPDRDLEWMTNESTDGASAVGHGSAADAARAASQREVVVLAPAGAVTLAEVELPTRNKAQMLKAVPYVLEDELAEPVDDLHFAVRSERGQKTLAAVVRRDWMERLLAQLRAEGIEPQGVVPETLCLPRGDQEWTLLIEDRGAVLRTGLSSGFAIDPDNLDAMLDAALADQDVDALSLIFIDRRAGETRPAPSLDVEVREHEGRESVLELLVSGYRERRPVNLLQGDFAVASNTGALWRRWRLAGALTLALAAVHLGTLALENQRYSRDIADLKQAMSTLYTETFPDSAKVVNPVAQMRNRLGELEQQSGPAVDYLALVIGAGKLVVGDAKVQVKRLRYRNSRIELDLEGESIERLEALQQRLRSAGYGAELRSVTNDGGRFQGRIELSGGNE